MPERGEEPHPPLLGRHRSTGGPGYRRVVGAHRARGLVGPPRGYLFTVALLAGTASMPILAAISAGSATVGGTVGPEGETRFLPSPSSGPVVVSPPPTELPVPGSRMPGLGDPIADFLWQMPSTTGPRSRRVSAQSERPAPRTRAESASSTPSFEPQPPGPSPSQAQASQPPAPSPNPTSSASPTPGPSPTPSPGRTPDASPSVSRSPRPSANSSPRPSLSPCPSVTVSYCHLPTEVPVWSMSSLTRFVPLPWPELF